MCSNSTGSPAIEAAEDITFAKAKPIPIMITNERREGVATNE